MKNKISNTFYFIRKKRYLKYILENEGKKF